MNLVLINSIEEFKEKYTYSNRKRQFFKECLCVIGVIEYYVNNYEDIDEDVEWFQISKYQLLTEWFIEKHKDRLYWDYISRYQPMSESFIETHSDKINWVLIFSNANLDIKYEFLEKNLYKFNLYMASCNLLTHKYNMELWKLIHRNLKYKLEIDKLSYRLNKISSYNN